MISWSSSLIAAPPLLSESFAGGGLPLLTLACGRQVWLDAFTDSHTYGGLLVGRPNDAINCRMTRETKPEIDDPWTTSPTATPKTN